MSIEHKEKKIGRRESRRGNRSRSAVSLGLPATSPCAARAVAMAGIYGMTARQIADVEGVPLGTAKTRIRDGMQKLRDAFLPEDVGDE